MIDLVYIDRGIQTSWRCIFCNNFCMYRWRLKQVSHPLLTGYLCGKTPADGYILFIMLYRIPLEHSQPYLNTLSCKLPLPKSHVAISFVIRYICYRWTDSGP